jgi:hypothetical protein
VVATTGWRCANVLPSPSVVLFVFRPPFVDPMATAVVSLPLDNHRPNAVSVPVAEYVNLRHPHVMSERGISDARRQGIHDPALPLDFTKVSQHSVHSEQVSKLVPLLPVGQPGVSGLQLFDVLNRRQARELVHGFQAKQCR